MKSVVLLSAGLDSTVNLYAAKKDGKVAMALTMDYGQRAAKKEIMKSKSLCQRLKIPHQVLRLPFVGAWGGSSLTVLGKKLPRSKAVQIDDLAVSQKTAKSVWVPNRNGIFLNVAAGLAESLKADCVIPGFNSEEAVTFPDNSIGFMTALDHCFQFSTANAVKVKCYTVKMNKAEIVEFGKNLDVDWSLIWPCYLSGKKWCGECESCQRSLRALKNE